MKAGGMTPTSASALAAQGRFVVEVGDPDNTVFTFRSGEWWGYDPEEGWATYDDGYPGDGRYGDTWVEVTIIPPVPWATEEKRNSGIKHDEGKPRYDLLPFDALEEIVHVLTFGSTKYAPDNWRHVKPLRRRYVSAMLRHVADRVMGERLDPETGRSHWASAGACVLFLLAEDLGNTPSPYLEVEGET